MTIAKEATDALDKLRAEHIEAMPTSDLVFLSAVCRFVAAIADIETEKRRRPAADTTNLVRLPPKKIVRV